MRFIFTLSQYWDIIKLLGDMMYKVTNRGVVLMIGSERKCFKWVFETFWDVPISLMRDLKITEINK